MTVTTTELHPAKRLKRIEALTAKYIAEGMPPTKAKRAAERKAPQRWQYTIRTQKPDGTYHTERKAGRAATAETTQLIGEARERELNAAWLAPKPPPAATKHAIPTLGVWFPLYRDILIAKGLADKSIQTRLACCNLILRQIGKDTLLSAIDADVVSRLQGFLRAHYSESHRANVLQALSNALNVAKAHGYLDYLRCEFKSVARLKSAKSRIVQIERSQFWIDSEFYRLLECAPHLKAEACFTIGRDAGLRSGELLGLEWIDVLDIHGRFPAAGTALRIERSRLWSVPELELKAWRDAGSDPDAKPKPRWIIKFPKSGHRREVPYTERLRTVLRKLWLASGKPTAGRVLGGSIETTPAPEAIAADVRWGTFSGWLETAERAAGLHPVPRVRRRPRKDNGPAAEGYGHLHKLRHSFCSGLAMRGVPVLTIQQLADHHSITVTEGYMWLAPGAKQSAVGLLDQPIGLDAPKVTLHCSTSGDAWTETKAAE